MIKLKEMPVFSSISLDSLDFQGNQNQVHDISENKAGAFITTGNILSWSIYSPGVMGYKILDMGFILRNPDEKRFTGASGV